MLDYGGERANDQRCGYIGSARSVGRADSLLAPDLDGRLVGSEGAKGMGVVGTICITDELGPERRR